MQLFRDVIDECGFMDLGFVGPRFTWSQHFDDRHSIQERLDRGLATDNWVSKFLGSRVHHLHYDSSGHSPLLINLLGLDSLPLKKTFRFEEMWLSDSRCGETVEVAQGSMENRYGVREIMMKIEKCGKELSWWNQNCFGNVHKELEKKKHLLVLVSLLIPSLMYKIKQTFRKSIHFCCKPQL